MTNRLIHGCTNKSKNQWPHREHNGTTRSRNTFPLVQIRPDFVFTGIYTWYSLETWGWFFFDLTCAYFFCHLGQKKVQIGIQVFEGQSGPNLGRCSPMIPLAPKETSSNQPFLGIFSLTCNFQSLRLSVHLRNGRFRKCPKELNNTNAPVHSKFGLHPMYVGMIPP